MVDLANSISAPEISIGPLPTSVPDQTVQTTATIVSSLIGAVVLETVESLPNDASTIISETFLPTTFSQYAMQTGTSTVLVTTQGTTLAALIGPGGLGWQLPSLASGEPAIQPPTTIPAGSETSQAWPTKHRLLIHRPLTPSSDNTYRAGSSVVHDYRSTCSRRLQTVPRRPMFSPRPMERITRLL